MQTDDLLGLRVCIVAVLVAFVTGGLAFLGLPLRLAHAVLWICWFAFMAGVGIQLWIRFRRSS